MNNPYFNLGGENFDINKTRSDKIKSTKGKSRLGAIEILRVNTIPPMEFGRAGDIVFIDDRDDNRIDQLHDDPTSVGMWMKYPSSYAQSLGMTGNMVIGKPGPILTNGNSFNINGTVVTITGNISSLQNTINNAAITNITAIIVGHALALLNDNNGPITVTNVVGKPLESLGLYSRNALTSPSKGFWFPISSNPAVTTSGSVGLSGNERIVLTALDPDVPQGRALSSGVATTVLDLGPSNNISINLDHTNVPTYSEVISSIDITDEILLKNISSNDIEKINLIDFSNVLNNIAKENPIPDTVQTRNEIVNALSGNVSNVNVGKPIPVGALVTSIAVEIISPFGPTAEIQVFDGNTLIDLLDNNLLDANIPDVYVINTMYEISTITQFKLNTINVTNLTGQLRVVIDYTIL